MELTHLSYSAIRTYRRCPRQFYLQYVMGYRAAEEPTPLRRGALFHELLAKHHGGQEPDYVGILPHYIQQDNGNDGTYEEEILRTLGTFLGYQESTEGQLPVGSTEINFSFKLSGAFVVEGVIDYLSEDHGLLVEHKLTAHPEVYTPLSTRLQIGIYLLETGSAEVVINCITPPGLKRGKRGSGEPRRVFVERIQKAFRESPGRYITRNTYNAKEWNLYEVAKTYHIIWDDITRKLSAPNPRLAFWQEDSACYLPSACEYLPCCETGADPDEIVGVYVKKEDKDLDNESKG